MGQAGQIIEWILKFLPFLEKLVEDITKIFHPSSPAFAGLQPDEKTKAASISKLLRDAADAVDRLAGK